MKDTTLAILRLLYRDIDGRSGMDMGQYDEGVRAEMVAAWWLIIEREMQSPEVAPHHDPVALLESVEA